MEIKLNLLPLERKEKIEEEKKFKKAFKWELELLFIVAVFLAMLFSISYILHINLAMAENNAGINGQDVERIKEIGQFDIEIKKINIKMSEILKMQGGQLYWTNFFGKLNETVPPEIAVNSIVTDNYSAKISGWARDRDILMTFKENLEKNDCFEGVDLPLSSLVAKENIDFTLGLSIKKECLKK